MADDGSAHSELVPVADLVHSDAYQVMPALGEDEYRALKASIRESTVEDPIVIDDADPPHVLDGHHRVRAARELGIEEIPARQVGRLSDGEKRDLAWQLNMQRRHFSEGEKRDRIADYFLDLEEREVRKTDDDIANTLGVSETWVRETRHDLVEAGKIGTGADFTTQQSVREQIKEALDDDPEVSDREVADDVGTSHPTVGNVRRGGAAGRRDRPRVFRHRPYLDSRAQEYLNKAARRIADREPEWVEDPTDPSVAECLRDLRERDPDAPEADRPAAGDRPADAPEADEEDDAPNGLPSARTVDGELLVDLLAAGLDYQETIYWMLYEYDGLDPVEVFHTTVGKEKSYSRDLDRHAIRNVERVLAAAAEKLDAEVDLDRSAYMYNPSG